MSSETPFPPAPEPGPAGLEAVHEPVLESIYKMGNKLGDASLELFLSEDEMLVVGKFTPPSAQGKLLVYQEIEDLFQTLGLVYGLQSRILQECIYHCNMNHRTIEKAPLARGTPARNEAPAFLKLEAHLFDHHFKQPETNQMADIDYKTISPFVIVKKGELLARAVKPREGIFGTTVRGNKIEPGKKEVKFLKPGPHTVYAHGKVFARCAGRFVVEGDVFDVSDTLDIAGGVDYSTGHIIFPGNINITGLVKDGFKIVSGATITSKDTLDASEVMCKKDLLCGTGIIGKKPGLVRIGGRLQAVFVENVQIEALGDLHISKTILGSKVYTNGNLIMEEGSKISASTVSVKGKLQTHTLGNDKGHVHIIVGTDFAVARKLDAVRAQYREEEDQLHRIKDRLAATNPGRWAEIEKETRAKLEALVAEINQLQQHLFSDELPELRIKGDIWPGTVIEMGHARIDVTEKQTAKVFKLSADRRVIVSEKMGKKDEEGEAE